MASTKVPTQLLAADENKRVTLTDAVAAGATGATDWVKLYGEIAVQITGAATAFAAQVQRSVVNPGSDGSTADPAPAGAALSGNPSTGVQPVAYTEPGVAWYRVNVTSVTGGQLRVALSGKGW